MASLPPLLSPSLPPSLPVPAASTLSGITTANVPAQPGTDAAALNALHPSLWRAHQLARSVSLGLSSGFSSLDAELPGGGWPKRVLTELLLPQAGIGEIRLLAPVLAQVQQGERQRHGSQALHARPVMLFDPPAPLCAQALHDLGLDAGELLVVQARTPTLPGTDSLWALEQALKSGHVGAVLAWLPPRLSPERLRRLQLAAAAHDGPAFVLREWTAQHRPSASPLRLTLQPAGADLLKLRIVKRRGPPLARPLLLELPPVLSPLAAQRARRGRVSGVPASAALPASDAAHHGSRASLLVGSSSTPGPGSNRPATLPAPLPAQQPLVGATFVQLDRH